jgi:hypothetical protein
MDPGLDAAFDLERCGGRIDPSQREQGQDDECVPRSDGEKGKSQHAP